MLRYIFGGEGLFVSHDGGQTFAMVCNSFIDPSSSARNGVAAVGGDGALFLGVFGGLWQADDGGCGWEITSGVGERWVTDVAHDPEDPEVLYVVTANGGDGVENGILKREAGDSWSELGAQEVVMIFRMYVVSTGSGSRRFVQSTTRGMLPRTIDGIETMVPNYVIRVSDDDAESFQEFPFVAPDDGSFFVAAVDPSNPDRMLAYIDRDASGDKADQVLVSVDGGESFDPFLEVTDFGGVAITNDGRVFIADRGSMVPDKPEGLWAAESLDAEPTELITDRRISCLGYQAATGTLFGCGLLDFGTIDQETGEYAPLAALKTMQSLVACDSVDVKAACQTQLCRDYCLSNHFPSAPLCEVYQTPSCGPCSDFTPSPLCHLNLAGSGGAGGASIGGAGGMPGAGGAGGSSGGAGGDPADGSSGKPEQADAGPTARGTNDSGCAVNMTGNVHGFTLHALWAIAIALGVRVRSRSRAPGRPPSRVRPGDEPHA